MYKFIHKHLLSITIGVIVLVFSYQFEFLIRQVVLGNNTCLASYDGFGYYMYLAQFFEQKHMYMTPEYLKSIQDQYCNGTVMYQLVQQPNGNYIDLYHMGMAFVELPGYVGGEIAAYVLGYEANGFTKPYHVANLLNALFFLLLGIYFFTKLLKRFFSSQLVAILLLIIYFGSNYFITAIQAYQLPHIFIFTLFSMFLYYLFKLSDNWGSKKYLIYAAAILGLISVIRPTHVLLGLIPLMLLKGRYPTKWAYWSRILVFLIGGFLFNLPQLLYWKIVGGSWLLLNLHVEEIIIVDAHISDFLFSYKKGWLLYSPVFLLLIPGFVKLYSINRRLFWTLLSSTLLLIFIFASWECWWYASSFGARVMVDLYPMLAIPLGYAIYWAHQKGRWYRFGMILFLLFTWVLSIFQSNQFVKGYLHHARMTKAHYWYIFGKSNISNYSDSRLEIDRDDPNWTRKYLGKNESFAFLKDTLFYRQKEILIKKDIRQLLSKKELLPTTKTDESLLQVQVIYEHQDSLIPPVICLETFSKYNVYSWNTLPLPTQRRVGEIDTVWLNFNLPKLHHKKDKLQVYVVNEGRKSDLKIHAIEIHATSLIRK